MITNSLAKPLKSLKTFIVLTWQKRNTSETLMLSVKHTFFSFTPFRFTSNNPKIAAIQPSHNCF